MRRLPVYIITLSLLLTSCESETYETGDGSLSHLTACFGMMHTREAQKADYVVADDGTTITFDTPANVEWATTADTLYRVQAYYKLGDKGTEPVAMNRMGVSALYEAKDMRQTPTDPLTFVSAWRGGGYLNVAFQVKTGKQEAGAEAQAISFVRDSMAWADGKRVAYIRMLHAQNNQPQYYSVRSYVAMRWPANCDRIVLTVNDYSGTKSKEVE